MNNMPKGFPLSPIDAKGNTLKEGDVVKVLCIPNWLIHDLDDESKQTVSRCEGSKMEIYEIDSYGYLWVEKVTIQTDENYESNSFCLEPKHVLLQQEA
ncbi:MAG: hypothetical protein ACRBEE_16085 [Arenicella sp.]